MENLNGFISSATSRSKKRAEKPTCDAFTAIKKSLATKVNRKRIYIIDFVLSLSEGADGTVYICC